jgi:hypothetical protein
MNAAHTETAPWEADILNQLADTDLAGYTHVVIHQPPDGPVRVADQGLAASKAEADIIAEDAATKDKGDVTIVTLNYLNTWATRNGRTQPPAAAAAEEPEQDDEDDALEEADDEPDDDEADEEPETEQPEDTAASTPAPDPETGQLFDTKKLKVKIDTTQPTLLKLAFSGGIELDVNDPSDVQLYNHLTAGKPVALTVEAHVAGAKKTHRRDSEGDVDAVVETKSVLIHSLNTTTR